MNESTEKKPRGKRLKKIGIWTTVGLTLMTVILAVGVMSVLGTRLSAPDWMRDRITKDINERLDNGSIYVGDVAVVLEQDLVPRLWLRDVLVHDAEGLPVANVADVQSQVALKPLLRGELHPRYIRVSGVRVALRREKEGKIALAVGLSQAPADRSMGFAAVMAQMDALLQTPTFADLDLVEADNLSLRYDDLRAGRSWSVDGGALSLTRDDDILRIRGDVVLLGARDYATTLEMNYSSPIGETAAQIGMGLQDMPSRDIAGQSPALAWLAALDAPISGALRASVDETGALGPLNATLQIGAGVVQPNSATTPIAFDAVRSYFTYDPKQQVLDFSELSVDSRWVKTSAEGRAYLVGMENGWPREILLQVGLAMIEANPDMLYPSAIMLGPARADLRLTLDPFVATLGELTLSDDAGRLVLSGEAGAGEDGWNVALDGRVDAINYTRVLELWPEAFVANARKWIAANVRSMDLSNVQLAVRSTPEHKADVHLGFDYAGLATQFVKNVPIIQDASGHGVLFDNQFVLKAQSGKIIAPVGGAVDISGTSFEIPDVRIKRTPAQIHLGTESTITAALSLLDTGPFRFMQKAEQPVDLADGRAALDGVIKFRMVDKLLLKDLAFDVDGVLSDVRSEVLVPNRVLSAQDLSVSVTEERLLVAGEGALGDVPFDGRFEAGLGPEAEGRSTVRGTIELSERFVDEFNINLPPGTLSGAGQSEMEIDFKKGTRPAFRLSSNLAGVALRMPDIDWSLPASRNGQLRVEGRLGQPPSIDLIALDAGGLNARGTISLKGDGQLDRASFTRVQVGGWIDAPVELVGRGPGVSPAVRVLGGQINLRETSLAGGGNSSGGAGQTRPRRTQTGPLSIVLDSLQISDGFELTDFRTELDMSNGADGAFSGRLNGATRVQGRIIPSDGRSAFRIQSDDAAGVFASAGLLKQARNGKLDLTLIPVAQSGTYDGRLRVTGGMRIKDTPAMAELLNAISVVGLLEQLGGDGIHFQDVDARFQLSPDRITLYSGSAVGASMGISMDGYFFMKDGRMDMQGVISPIYLVNGIGGFLTRRGEGLVGFNYAIKGTKDAPRVSVNPLSVFTPGMFRDLFRRSPPKRDAPEEAVSQQQNADAVDPGLTVAPRSEPSRNLGQTNQQHGGR